MTRISSPLPLQIDNDYSVALKIGRPIVKTKQNYSTGVKTAHDTNSTIHLTESPIKLNDWQRIERVSVRVFPLRELRSFCPSCSHGTQKCNEHLSPKQSCNYRIEGKPRRLNSVSGTGRKIQRPCALTTNGAGNSL
jgi:hypothetical protein